MRFTGVLLAREDRRCHGTHCRSLEGARRVHFCVNQQKLSILRLISLGRFLFFYSAPHAVNRETG